MLNESTRRRALGAKGRSLVNAPRRLDFLDAIEIFRVHFRDIHHRIHAALNRYGLMVDMGPIRR